MNYHWDEEKNKNPTDLYASSCYCHMIYKSTWRLFGETQSNTLGIVGFERRKKKWEENALRDLLPFEDIVSLCCRDFNRKQSHTILREFYIFFSFHPLHHNGIFLIVYCFQDCLIVFYIS